MLQIPSIHLHSMKQAPALITTNSFDTYPIDSFLCLMAGKKTREWWYRWLDKCWRSLWWLMLVLASWNGGVLMGFPAILNKRYKISTRHSTAVKLASIKSSWNLKIWKLKAPILTHVVYLVQELQHFQSEIWPRFWGCIWCRAASLEWPPRPSTSSDGKMTLVTFVGEGKRCKISPSMPS